MQLEQLLPRILDYTNDVLIITDAEDINHPRILYVNEAFTKMTGYSAEEVLGKSPHMFQ
jgi:PAS domain S-box-containing protein